MNIRTLVLVGLHFTLLHTTYLSLNAKWILLLLGIVGIVLLTISCACDFIFIFTRGVIIISFNAFAFDVV